LSTVPEGTWLAAGFTRSTDSAGDARAGWGSIINIVSIEGLRPSKGIGIYSVSKAALILLTQALAQELGPDGIRVNALAPGLVRTDLSAALWQAPAVAEAVAARTPLRRLGEPEDVVGAALFLASSASAYISGAVITVDGGLTAGGPLG